MTTTKKMLCAREMFYVAFFQIQSVNVLLELLEFEEAWLSRYFEDSYSEKLFVRNEGVTQEDLSPNLRDFINVHCHIPDSDMFYLGEVLGEMIEKDKEIVVNSPTFQNSMLYVKFRNA